MPLDDVELLTYQEAADALRISTRTLKNWAQAGEIPVVYLRGRLPRFRKADVQALIEDRKRDEESGAA